MTAGCVCPTALLGCYCAAGRLEYVTEPPLVINSYVAGFEYDKNGNRSKLTYYLTGNPLGSTVSIDYTYDLDNNLRGFTTTGGPTFNLSNTTVDGLGRLRYADETITKTDGGTLSHSYTYEYDMLSRLRYAYRTNVPPTPAREYAYDYDNAGNLIHFMFNNYNPDEESHTYFTYTGDLRTGGSGGAVGWYDLNGRQTSLLDDRPHYYPLEYDWDGNLRYGQFMNPSMGMEAKYDPEGVRIYKHRIWNLDSYWHKYIVDTTDDLPKILLVLDANDNNAILKTYVHANNQILMQHDGDVNSPRYFYLHDRLGSVRQIVDSSGEVANCYYYTPWGSVTGSESSETVSNWYGWAGYLSDEEIDSYYCNARQYNAARFMTRDPVRGNFREPMTLHAYLYCLNDPINRLDPTGEIWGFLASSYARAKDTAASYGALAWAKQKIYFGATMLNAFRSGMINMYTGPDSISDSTKFAIGFVSGAMEMQVGLRINATTGALVGSIITNTANQLLSKEKSLGWAAIDVALSAGLGGIADWMEPEGVRAIEMFLIGIDKDLILNAAKGFVDFFED